MQKQIFNLDEISLPFILIIPDNINNNSSIILNGITPIAGLSYGEALRDSIQEAMDEKFSPLYKKLVTNYNNIMLIPIIPRAINMYTGYLGYNIYHEEYENAIKYYEEKKIGFSSTDLDKFRKLDSQIAYMINYAVSYINNTYSLSIDNKVIATGYSASSKMAIHFSALHPNLVKMIIAGGTSGLGTFPIKEINGKNLTYPLGFADLPDKNLELYKNIPQFYYIGEKDTLDPSKPKFERKFIGYDQENNPIFEKDEMANFIPNMANGKIKYIFDENGEYILPNGGYYSLEQTHIIIEELGSNPQDRFDLQKKNI